MLEYGTVPTKEASNNMVTPQDIFIGEASILRFQIRNIEINAARCIACDAIDINWRSFANGEGDEPKIENKAIVKQLMPS